MVATINLRRALSHHSTLVTLATPLPNPLNPPISLSPYHTVKIGILGIGLHTKTLALPLPVKSAFFLFFCPMGAERQDLGCVFLPPDPDGRFWTSPRSSFYSGGDMSQAVGVPL